MKFTLHPHQTRALDMLRSSLGSGKRRPMVQAPTGFGKTLLAASIVEGARAKGNRVLFTVPSISLVDQTVGRFYEQGIHCVGVMQGQHPLTDGTQPVQVASIQTLMRRKLPKADLVVIDEAHQWFQFVGEWMADGDWRRVPFIGLSATPWTKGLGKHYDDLLVAARIGELIDGGFLSPFKVFAPSHPDLSKVRTVAGDYHEGQLSDVMRQPTLVADVVSTWLRLGEERPTLCFAVDRAHARKLANEFEAAGVPCGYVDANTPGDERTRMGQRLAEGQLRVICNVGCLTTGVDWDVRCIILARPTKSEMLFTQIIGRGLRTAEGKDHCLILDHSDTTLRLGFVTDIHHNNLDLGKHQTGGGVSAEKEPPKPKECPSCSYLKPAGVHQCPSCGFVPERQSPIEEKAGELVQLNGRRAKKAEATPEEKQAFYSMALAYQRAHGKSEKFAVAKYKAKFGVWPRGLNSTLIEPDEAFLRALRADQIRWAKKQEKLKREVRHAA
ncbi:MAG: DEAD/DEAH box helicase [Pseudomonadota bacterium]|nr:DEAD/DEAH box helicase [Pseudomonadota bacterium]